MKINQIIAECKDAVVAGQNILSICLEAYLNGKQDCPLCQHLKT